MTERSSPESCQPQPQPQLPYLDRSSQHPTPEIKASAGRGKFIQGSYRFRCRRDGQVGNRPDDDSTLRPPKLQFSRMRFLPITGLMGVTCPSFVRHSVSAMLALKLRRSHYFFGVQAIVVGLTLAAGGCGRSTESAPNSGSARPARHSLDSTESPSGSVALSQSKLPIYQLTMATEDLGGLEDGSYSNNPRPATFTCDGVEHRGVQVRVRGQWSRGWPKKSLKILFADAQPFQRRHSLNLNSGWRDPAFVREVLAYHIYSVCGAPASEAKVIRLEVNGKFRGLYIDVEQPSKSFLERKDLRNATVFKALGRANQADEREQPRPEHYRLNYSQESHHEDGDLELATFCRNLARAPNLEEFFETRVEVNRYVNYLAATVLTQNWDSLNKNHFLIFDRRGSKKWLVIPWDLDRTLGDHWSESFSETELPILLGTQRQPGVTGWNRLEERFFSVPQYRAHFKKRLQELLESEFTPEKLFPYLDQLEASIASDSVADRARWGGGNTHRGIAQVKDFIRRRRSFLKAELLKL